MTDITDDLRFGPEVRYDEILDEDGVPIEGLDIDDERSATTIDEVAEFHLQGQHDQQSHGRRGAVEAPDIDGLNRAVVDGHPVYVEADQDGWKLDPARPHRRREMVHVLPESAQLHRQQPSGLDGPEQPPRVIAAVPHDGTAAGVTSAVRKLFSTPERSEQFHLQGQHDQQTHAGDTRIVRNKSIPNVDDERLVTDLKRLHGSFHTPEGLHRFDGPRRNMIDNGKKIKLIAAELEKRDVPNPVPNCRFCAAPRKQRQFHLQGQHNQDDHGRRYGATRALSEPDGGMTLTAESLTPMKTGYAVAIGGTDRLLLASDAFDADGEPTRELKKLTADRINAARATVDRPDGTTTALGGWHNPEDGKVEVNVTIVFPQTERARAMKFARENDQISMADLEAIDRGDWPNSIISTGGTGGTRDIDDPK